MCQVKAGGSFLRGEASSGWDREKWGTVKWPGGKKGLWLDCVAPAPPSLENSQLSPWFAALFCHYYEWYSFSRHRVPHHCPLCSQRLVLTVGWAGSQCTWMELDKARLIQQALLSFRWTLHQGWPLKGCVMPRYVSVASPQTLVSRGWARLGEPCVIHDQARRLLQAQTV